MWSYRNSRTGQVVDLPARSARLDALPNWAMIGAPLDDIPDETGVGRMIPDTAGHDGAPDADAADQVVMVTVDDLVAAEQVTLPRPPDNAPKAAWVAYAIARGATESDARALRKDALIEEYGGPDGED
ncbi:hypothetical protein [Nonomuraea sp. LPB2021202275-12-8]|uniref:hypothetical protein n=1 Tax=Nonomuraea sp. LPB2021202275-12-8 TaxID=3120159 RepID=UPI00300CD9AC